MYPMAAEDYTRWLEAQDDLTPSDLIEYGRQAFVSENMVMTRAVQAYSTKLEAQTQTEIRDAYLVERRAKGIPDETGMDLLEEVEVIMTEIREDMCEDDPGDGF